MKYHVVRHVGTGQDSDYGPLSDDALLDLLDALVEERGRVPAARVLGVNYRTLAICCDSREVSRRMRRALLDCRNADASISGEREDGDGDRPPNGGVAALEQRVSDLEDENFELRELVDEQSRQLEELARRVAALEGGQQSGDNIGGDAGDDVRVDETSKRCNDDFGQDWRPPRRRPGMPDARRELGRAKRAWWLRRVITLRLWK